MRADRLLRSQIHERFVVTTTSGETFDGLLVDCDRSTVLLAQAHMVAATGDRVKVDGQLFVPRDQVAYLQRP